MGGDIYVKNVYRMHRSIHEGNSATTNFDEVVLFGPTNAKAELLNVLKADHRFENIKIEVQQADKMSDKQQQAFVKEYFSKTSKSNN